MGYTVLTNVLRAAMPGAPVTFGVDGNAASSHFYGANGGGTKGGDTTVNPDLATMNGGMVANAEKAAVAAKKLAAHQAALGYMAPGCPKGMKAGKGQMCL